MKKGHAITIYVDDGSASTWEDLNMDETTEVVVKGKRFVVKKFGQWEKLYDGNYKCSHCGAWFCTRDDYGNPEDKMPDYKYCPNCGASMETDSE